MNFGIFDMSMSILKPLFISVLFFCLFTISGFCQPTSGIVNTYRKVISIDTAKGIVRLSNASNLVQFIGHSVMIIQMKGATIDQSNTSSFGNITTLGNCGRFEIGRMCGQLTDSIVLENKLQNFYDVSGFVQLVFMPKYTDLNVSGTIIAAPWNPADSTGGIVAIEASGTVTLNASISADSAGYRGGALLNQANNCSNTFAATNYYYSAAGTLFGGGGKKGEGVATYISGEEYGKGKQANGGGGGNILNTGGGGGGGYAPGGIGGSRTMGSCINGNPGIGGAGMASLGFSNSQFRVFMGGGGGAGQEDNNLSTPGGNGGGIVYIKANQIIGSGNKISANGNSGYNSSSPTPYSAESDGGGGGGGGGTVILDVNSITTLLTVETKGGKGSNTENSASGFCSGPGGGGGGGFIWSRYLLPANVILTSTGGINGVILTTCTGASNGAAAGSLGSYSSGFAFPTLRDSSAVCKQILPFKLISSFSGSISNEQLHLTLRLTSVTGVYKSILQYSTDGITFTDMVTQNSNYSMTYYFVTPCNNTPSFYRAKVVTTSGTAEFSTVLYFKPNIQQDNISLFPNPVTSDLNMYVKVTTAGPATLSVFDITGRKVYKIPLQLSAGYNSYHLKLPALVAGVYTLELWNNNFRAVRKFIHL